MEKAFSIGKLVDFQWKLGVATSSSLTTQLNTPFISVFIKVVDANEQVSSHSFELTVPEFQNFAQQFKDMSQLMVQL
ncbi:hypothetical protein CYY_007743 [Polysphondylium violaceum]|uniref:COMM domain-containing protein 6 n=1 Tax=Polysphondylium violaceum TaxID=133409 RepID=A0A8J4V1Y6_9MYCE|nr:hypothetical protein CYY_007743 [Polysphondylium violaceum]